MVKSVGTKIFLAFSTFYEFIELLIIIIKIWYYKIWDYKIINL